MKSILILSLALTLVSCGGSSNGDIGTFSAPINFSENKNNEDLLGKFVLPEMKKVTDALESIKTKTQNCSNDSDFDGLKQDWGIAALAYQRLRPVEASILDRDPQVALKLKERYLDGAYSAHNCRLQHNTAEEILRNNTLTFNPAINSIEFFIYSDIENTNFCGGTHTAAVDAWLLTENKTRDICNQINLIARVAVEELTEINKSNGDLYEAGKSNEVFAANNLQTLYDNMSIFIDQVLKDNSVGQPLGLSSKCPFTGRTCPTAIEHPFSKLTFDAISKNLEGVMAIYNQQTSMNPKPQAKGLYQFLLANQKTQVADEFYDNLIEAHRISTELHGQDFTEIAASLDGAENKEACLNTTVENKIVPACALFKSIKSLSDKVKFDLRLALAVSTPNKIEGDSD